MAFVSQRWKSVGTAVEGHEIDVDGVNPWGLTWHRVQEEPVSLPHPEQPERRHPLTIYRAEHGGKTVTFAAAELSPTVWGFYVPVAVPARSIRVSRLLKAPRADVYRALLDPRAIATWRIPKGMTSEIHVFEARVGGRFRVTLTYDDPTAVGKSTTRKDTYHGRFAELVPDEQVVEVIEFETTDPSLAGEMSITTTLADVAGGTLLTAEHDNLPEGLSPEDNEQGWNEALAKLAAYLEA